MKEKISIISSSIFYLLAVLFIGIYFYIELIPNMAFDTTQRVFHFCLICLFIYLGSLLLSKYLKNNKPLKISLWIFFILYLILLITLVAFDYFRGNSSSVNIIPFDTIRGYVKAFLNSSANLNIIVYNLVGNIVCLTPLAFFLPILFKKQNKFKIFLITTIGITLCIEFLQLITMSGAFDVDDIILNVLGASIAYLILNIKGIKALLNNIFLLEKNKLDKKDWIKVIVVIVIFIVIIFSLIVIKNNDLNNNYSVEFIDESTTCKEGQEKIYESEKYIYYFNCLKSDKVYVRFNGKDKYLLKDILNNNPTKYEITEHDLDYPGIGIIKEAKMTELVLTADLGNKAYNFKQIIENEDICNLILDKNFRQNGILEQHFFIKGIKEGRTIIELKYYNIETNEELYLKKYEIIIDNNLKASYKELN